MKTTQCPTCKSNAPHLHPAMQSGGEVEVCADSYHLQPTPENKPAYMELVMDKQRNPTPPRQLRTLKHIAMEKGYYSDGSEFSTTP